MKSSGIVRRMDMLGRIVVPKETRARLCIQNGDSVEFFTDSDSVYLKKYARGCMFCHSMENVLNYKGKYICDKCRAELTEFAKERG